MTIQWSKSIRTLVFLTGLFTLVAEPIAAAKRYPVRPITNTVVWGAGGGTDSINRMIMAEMAKELDVRITVTNKTGGVAGSIGMSHVLSKRPDGYNLVGISESNVTAAVNGGWSERFDVWSPFIVGGSPDVISVGENSRFKTLQGLIEFAKQNPGEIKAAAGGTGSIHHLNLLALMKGTGADFKFIPYPGSAPSQSAAVTQEVDIVITSVAEQAPLIKGDRLRPLAMLTSESFKLGKVDAIPSAFETYEQLQQYLPIQQAIGFAVAEKTPEAIKQKLTAAFEKAIRSKPVVNWANNNYYTLSGKHGEHARQEFAKLESLFGWTLYELGSAKYSPEKFGIAKPES